MNYVVDYEICATFFLILLMVLSSMKRRMGDFQSKLYQTYLLGTFMSLCMDIITSYTIAYYDYVPVWLNYLLNSIFCVIQFLIPTLFMLYVHFKVMELRTLESKYIKMIFFPAGLGVLLVLTNLWTKALFFFDETGYHHGKLHMYLYLNAIIYTVGTLCYMIYMRRLLKQTQCVLVVLIVLVSLLPVVVQMFFPNYMLSGVGAALSVFIICFTSESMTEYMDRTTGALNREALAFHMHESKKLGRLEQIFIIALDNFKIVNEMYGMEGGNRILQMVVNGLQEVYSESAIFRFGGDNFVVVIEEKTEGVKELDRIRKVVKKKCLVDGEVVELSACVGLIHSIHHKEEDLFHAMEYAVTKAKSKGKGQFFEVEEDTVKDISRKTAIEQAIVAAIDSGHFEVHYQPIFDTRSKRFHSMEALARLRVEGFGYVSPEEFILIAEQNGTINQIGLLVLNEVCQCIKQYNLKDKGIDFVEVNLSIMQCMQENIYQDIMDVLKRYNIPPSMVNLEITESAAAYSEDLLTKNMARISLTDITFSLDDYGSGYSNINYLVDLPFSIVKVDKYFVWAAMKKVTSRKILENMIGMFKAIDLKVVAEGIEDWEMTETVTSMGVDYLQGYFFSKPIPKERLMQVLEKEYLEELLEKCVDE